MTENALVDLVEVRANWLALAVFGREQYCEASGNTVNDIQISSRSYALLFADIAFLLVLFDNNQ